jgi:hypothetical protein
MYLPLSRGSAGFLKPMSSSCCTFYTTLILVDSVCAHRFAYAPSTTHGDTVVDTDTVCGLARVTSVKEPALKPKQHRQWISQQCRNMWPLQLALRILP